MTDQRTRIAKAFRAAHDYDRNARIQRMVAQRLAVRIAALDLPANPRILEIGCGTGFLTQALMDAGVSGDWQITDIAPEMVDRCRGRLGETPRRRFAVLDGERDTPCGGPFDLICSSLAVQWFDDAPAALARMAGWLAPGGHCVITTLGPGSFAQWHAAHESQGVQPGTPRFAAIAGFAALEPHALAVEHLDERHDDAHGFVRALKAIGAGTPGPDHRPLAAGAMRRVMAAFERGGCAVTYEVVTCHLHRAR